MREATVRKEIFKSQVRHKFVSKLIMIFLENLLIFIYLKSNMDYLYNMKKSDNEKKIHTYYQ